LMHLLYPFVTKACRLLNSARADQLAQRRVLNYFEHFQWYCVVDIVACFAFTHIMKSTVTPICNSASTSWYWWLQFAIHTTSVYI
jgi:hypothetical protein